MSITTPKAGISLKLHPYSTKSIYIHTDIYKSLKTSIYTYSTGVSICMAQFIYTCLERMSLSRRSNFETCIAEFSFKGQTYQNQQFHQWKLLWDLPESQRADAVNSMVYEAGARIRDPVYGSAGAIYHLQRQVSELQAQLAKAQVELVSVQLQRANLLALLCNQPNVQDQLGPYNHLSSSFESGDDFISSPDEESNDLGYFLDDNTNSSMSWWDHPLLT
ncbi:PREDICTED: LOB domain-containing protein 11-like isoform X1 [Tarenaya hassleriana]|uniref:LOB domain-containing protein 11-like isoform X1 n=1 Tax=Tarenaya hassleriana TaxID=28532 RepID=UPI0008FD6D24|nr:PREDICTED: LOB domain-containing protein 11-like isoform X1 [Tarenaya hassleriana]